MISLYVISQTAIWHINTAIDSAEVSMSIADYILEDYLTCSNRNIAAGAMSLTHQSLLCRERIAQGGRLIHPTFQASEQQLVHVALLTSTPVVRHIFTWGLGHLPGYLFAPEAVSCM